MGPKTGTLTYIFSVLTSIYIYPNTCTNYWDLVQLDKRAKFLSLLQGNQHFLVVPGAEGGHVVGSEGKQVTPVLLGHAGLEGAKVDKLGPPGG